MGTKRHQEIEYEVGSGNVFADLGLKDAEAMFTRAQIGFYLRTLLKARKLKPREIAALFETTPPKVSDLLNGQYGGFTIDQLFECLKRLDRKVTIRISQHHTGEPYQKVEFPPEQALTLSRKKRNAE